VTLNLNDFGIKSNTLEESIFKSFISCLYRFEEESKTTLLLPSKTNAVPVPLDNESNLKFDPEAVKLIVIFSLAFGTKVIPVPTERFISLPETSFFKL